VQHGVRFSHSNVSSCASHQLNGRHPRRENS
jgi:hypothetical protein